MLWFALLLFAGALETPAAPGPATVPPLVTTADVPVAALLAAPGRRVRSTDGRVAALLADGARRSPTFAALVAEIHRSDVIVYVQASFALPAGLSGRLQLQGATGTGRYLRVEVRAAMNRDEMIAVIAHELRHALEVAADRTVVDDAALLALYRRIGHASHSARGFDTEAANTIGRRVRDELAA
jgi:hypothetical protein